MQYAILIDAGFLKHKLGSAKRPMTIEQIRDLINDLKNHPELKEHRLHRIYYYDALPFLGKNKKPLSAEITDFSKTDTVERQEQLLASVKKEPFFAVRLGELSFEGWQIKPKLLKTSASQITVTSDDMRPKISQKGVDMRVGMDMAALVLKHIAQILVLVTGDSDFVPAMKFARREGAAVYMVPLGHPIKEIVKEHCDLIFEDIMPKKLIPDTCKER